MGENFDGTEDVTFATAITRRLEQASDTSLFQSLLSFWRHSPQVLGLFGTLAEYRDEPSGTLN
jgi:hypothetical protein